MKGLLQSIKRLFFKGISSGEDELGPFVKVRDISQVDLLPTYTTEDIDQWIKENPDLKLLRGATLDTETTGLEKDDEIIELGITEVLFTQVDGVYRSIAKGRSFNQLQEPKVKEITPEITEITGITPKMVKGHNINWEEARGLIAEMQVIFAHNAAFDFGMCKGVLFEESKIVWVCTKDDVPWKENGFINNKQENLCLYHGFTYGGHRAVNDTEANAYLMSLENYLDQALKSAKEDEFLVVARDTDYNQKDRPEVKALKLRWFDNKAGEKFWYKRMNDPKEASELANQIKKVAYGHKPKKVQVYKIPKFHRWDSLDEIIKRA